MNPVFQRLTELVDAVSRGATGLGDAPAGTPQRLWEETRSWVGRFFTSATAKWLPFYGNVVSCAVSELREGVPFPCTNNAIGRCAACGEPTCLHHAFVDQHGDAVCYPCIGKAIRAGRAAGPPPGASAGGQGVPPAQAAAIRREQIRLALAALGLKPGASVADVKKRHRTLAAKHHPDKARGERARREATETCARVNGAFAELQRLDYKPEDR